MQRSMAEIICFGKLNAPIGCFKINHDEKQTALQSKVTSAADGGLTIVDSLWVA